MAAAADNPGRAHERARRWAAPLGRAGPEPGLVRVAAPAAAAMALVLLATASRYELHGDELYFRMLPLAWWYEDQPPLTVWLSHLAALISDQIWVQRVPAIVAAVVGVFLAAAAPRLLGFGQQVQRVAAWAHAGTVYPLLVGHVFLTSSIDLIVWQGVLLLVLAAMRGRRSALMWAGVVAGLGCWNKLLVLVLVAALLVALTISGRRLLRTRWAAAGLGAIVALGGVQVMAQVLHGLPMSQVSGDLVGRNGGAGRWLVLPLLVAFLGPPLAGVWWRGLGWRPGDGKARDEAAGPVLHRLSSAPVLAVTAALITAWTVAFPAQPYYPVAAFLPALAIGWGGARDADAWSWRHRRVLVGANSAVALMLSLPLLPTSSPGFQTVAAINPVHRDQAGWRGYVEQVAKRRDTPEATVLTDSYALAGAVAHYGPSLGIARDRVASGHNALWNLGPPVTDAVLLVGSRVVGQRNLFHDCSDAGVLEATDSNPFGVAGSPMVRCTGPLGGWGQVWPSFRHLGA